MLLRLNCDTCTFFRSRCWTLESFLFLHQFLALCWAGFNIGRGALGQIQLSIRQYKQNTSNWKPDNELESIFIFDSIHIYVCWGVDSRPAWIYDSTYRASIRRNGFYTIVHFNSWRPSSRLFSTVEIEGIKSWSVVIGNFLILLSVVTASTSVGQWILFSLQQKAPLGLRGALAVGERKVLLVSFLAYLCRIHRF